jgi:pyrroline-5-carboxylate reductase
MNIGILGVGTVSTAVVHAMCSRPADASTFILSPRSEDRSTELADRYTQCTRAGSNQDVIDRSDIVILSMRPQQMDSALAELTFRPDQIIASFVAGSPPSQLSPLVEPATQICQLIPLPAIEIHRGPLLICPGIPDVTETFAGLGDVIVLEDESLIRVFSVASAFMSTYYEMQNTVIDWAESRGLDRTLAAKYVLSELDGLAAVGKQTSLANLDSLPAEHQTKGGLNERVRATMLDQGAFRTLRSALDDVYDNAQLRTPDHPAE